MSEQPRATKTGIELIRQELLWHRIVGGLFGAIFFGVITWYLPKELNQARELARGDTRTELAAQLAPINEKLGRLDAAVEFLKPAAAKRVPEVLRESLKEDGQKLKSGLQKVGELAQLARQGGIKADRRAIAQVGQKVLDVERAKPEYAPVAWQAASQLVNYQSFLNSDLAPGTSNFSSYPSLRVQWEYDVPFSYYKGEAVHFALKAGRPVSAERAAVMERIEHHLNTGARVGPEFLLVEGISSPLDGFRLKNVIFRNSKIIYGDGPVEMEDVYFVNCTFDVPRSPKGRELLAALFASAAATFKAS